MHQTMKDKYAVFSVLTPRYLCIVNCLLLTVFAPVSSVDDKYICFLVSIFEYNLQIIVRLYLHTLSGFLYFDRSRWILRLNRFKLALIKCIKFEFALDGLLALWLLSPTVEVVLSLASAIFSLYISLGALCSCFLLGAHYYRTSPSISASSTS